MRLCFAPNAADVRTGLVRPPYASDSFDVGLRVDSIDVVIAAGVAGFASPKYRSDDRP